MELLPPPPPKKKTTHTELSNLRRQVPLEGWLQIVLFVGHYEGYFWRQDPKRAPGDYEGRGSMIVCLIMSMTVIVAVLVSSIAFMIFAVVLFTMLAIMVISILTISMISKSSVVESQQD